MSSKIEFVEKASQPGANIAALCREYEISRQTAYKYLRRFREAGYAGLEEQSRRPSSTPLGTAEDVVVAVLAARAKHPRWGAHKLVGVLRQSLGDLTPSERTIHRLLLRVGQVRSRRKKRKLSIVEHAPTVTTTAPNDVWTIDLKGWWRARDGSRCEPLTIRDAHTRYVLAVVLMPRTTGERVRHVMERLFRRHGIPKAIHCDNGSPFISSQSLGGLTKLSAWWVSLGIRIVRSRPGCPQDNGAHERMHADIAADLQADPEATLALQQRACDRWRQEFNDVRPHAALANKTPGELYRSSPVKPRMRSPTYPLTWTKRIVSCNGEVRVNNQDYFVSTALARYQVALEPLGGLRCRVWFYDVILGEIEVEHLSDWELHRIVS